MLASPNRYNHRYYETSGAVERALAVADRLAAVGSASTIAHAS